MSPAQRIPTKKEWNWFSDWANHYYTTAEAHPAHSKVLDQLYDREYDLRVSYDQDIRSTKWGRCRMARRKEEVSRQIEEVEHTLEKIVRAKWIEDEYVERVTKAAEQERNAQVAVEERVDEGKGEASHEKERKDDHEKVLVPRPVQTR